MSELISNKEAKLAWANGEDVELKSHHWDNWQKLTDDFSLSVFAYNEYKFRLKPRTISLNGVEVKPPKDINVFSEKTVKLYCDSTEDALLMAAALRSVLKGV